MWEILLGAGQMMFVSLVLMEQSITFFQVLRFKGVPVISKLAQSLSAPSRTDVSLIGEGLKLHDLTPAS